MVEATIRMICPNLRCKSILSVPQAARGKSVMCKQCGMKIKIPAVASGGKKAS